MRTSCFLLLTIFIFSCENEKYPGVVNLCPEETETSALSLSVSQIQKIVQPAEFDGEFVHYAYHSFGGSEYIVFCGDGQSIQFFNMTTGLLEKVVEPNKAVPLINEVLEFYVKSLDSIFFFNDIPPKAFLVNSSGGLINSWDLKGAPINWDGVEDYGLYKSHSGFEMMNGKFYVSLNTSSFFRIKDRLGLETQAVYDVIGEDWDRVYGKLPDFYANDRDVDFIGAFVQPQRIISGDNIVISYPQSHEIHVYNAMGDLMGEYCASSKFVDKLDEPMTKEQSKDRQQSFFRFSAAPAYLGIYYHSELDIYTRLVRHKFDIEGASGKLRSPCEISYSLIVLDSNFNKTGEVKLDGHLYDWRFAKATPSGFWLMPICDDWPGEDVMNYTTHLKLGLSDI